jgi:hypothetical protein
MLTQQKLKELLTYDPDSGIFTWLQNRGAARIGGIAGSVFSNGYRYITIDEKRYMAHRLAWLYVFGVFPPNHIDHINGGKSDNRWINLRAVTRSQNLRNAKRRSDNTSGRTGVSWDSLAEKWKVDIRGKDKKHIFKTFNIFEDAVSWRESKERELNYHANHGR